jgi:hypothetical protein
MVLAFFLFLPAFNKKDDQGKALVVFLRFDFGGQPVLSSEDAQLCVLALPQVCLFG